MRHCKGLFIKFSVKSQLWFARSFAQPKLGSKVLFRRGSTIMLWVFSLLMGHAIAWADTLSSPQNAISPKAALERLMEGNARYVENIPRHRDFSAERSARATAQYPIAAILSCADSRVAPELVFDQGPGDIFLVRVAGNFMNEDGLASIEYALKLLGVPLIMVLGHSHCGAVSAAIKWVKEQAKLPGHLPQLVSTIKPAVEVAQYRLSREGSKPRVESDLLLQHATIENVRLNVQQLSNCWAYYCTACSSRKSEGGRRYLRDTNRESPINIVN